MSKLKVVSIGDRYAVRRLGDDGGYTIVKGSYRESWSDAEKVLAEMERGAVKDSKAIAVALWVVYAGVLVLAANRILDLLVGGV